MGSISILYIVNTFSLICDVGSETSEGFAGFAFVGRENSRSLDDLDEDNLLFSILPKRSKKSSGDVLK